MENTTLLLMIEAISNEKNIALEDVFGILEESLALVTNKQKKITSRIEIDRKTGGYVSFRQWLVVDDDAAMIGEDEVLYNEEIHIDESKAGGKAIGEFVEEEIESIEFGRIAAQTVKQLINQKVREAERLTIIESYKNKVGEIITASIRHIDRGNVYLDLGGIDGMIAKKDTIPNESMRKGDRVRAFVKEIKPAQRGVQIFLSRTTPEFLIELFSMEVPEISSNIIEIMGGARDPGLRAKLAVRAKDKRIDPVGSCIGMRGSRVQTVSNELNGERVDVILWDENPAQFVINAIAPAEVSSLTIDYEKNSMDLVVEEEELAKAIGRGGQNIRLASQLTDWRLNVMSHEDAAKKQEEENAIFVQKLNDSLFLDEKVIKSVVAEGWTSIEDLNNLSKEELLKVEGFDETIVTELQEAVEDAMLSKALNDDSDTDNLLEIAGIDEALAMEMIANNVRTREDLAELSMDELLDIQTMDTENAEKLIMAAREAEGWFKE
jgi:N utilization substance protein A